MITPEVLRAAKAIDWDFVVPRVGYSPPPHWYPATLPQAVSDALVELVCPPNGVVFDPYCGVGTIGASAQRLGRSSVVADINPIACVAAFATCALASPSSATKHFILGILDQLEVQIAPETDLPLLKAERVPAGANDNSVRRALSSAARAALGTVRAPPRWDLLAPWVSERVLIDLKTRFDNLLAEADEVMLVLGLCAFSAIVRSLSSQTSSWGHIADNVKPKRLVERNVDQAIRRWLHYARRFAQDPVADFPGRPEIQFDVRCIDWTAEHVDGLPRCDLLLTSPPYADAIDYLLSQRLSLYLFGYNDAQIQNLVGSEIGARRKRFRSTSRSEWVSALCSALQRQVRYLSATANVCLILPHKDSGRDGGQTELRLILQELGFAAVFEADRSIRQSHTRQSWTSIKKETIVFFARAD